MRYPPLKTTLLALGLLGLTACGGDDDTDGDTSQSTDAGAATGGAAGEGTDGPGGTTGSGDGEPGSGGGGGTAGPDGGGATGSGDGGTTPTGGGNAELTDATPRYLTAACGDLPVSDVPYSNSASVPATMLPDMLVAGRIDPESNGNTEHYWSVELQPGHYHLLLETERVDDAGSNLGIELTDLNGPGEDDDRRLLRGNEVGYRARFHEFLEVEEARTVVIRATPNFAAEDYTLALFGNGTAVPSPRFDDCPTIVPLSVGTTEALTLPADGPDGDRWYEIDLQAQDYLIDWTATRTDGASGNIIHEFGHVDRFGQDSRYERVARANEVGVSSSDSAPLRRSEAGPVWIRLDNGNAELNVEFTIQPDG